MSGHLLYDSATGHLLYDSSSGHLLYEAPELSLTANRSASRRRFGTHSDYVTAVANFQAASWTSNAGKYGPQDMRYYPIGMYPWKREITMWAARFSTSAYSGQSFTNARVNLSFNGLGRVHRLYFNANASSSDPDVWATFSASPYIDVGTATGWYSLALSATLTLSTYLWVGNIWEPISTEPPNGNSVVSDTIYLR